MIRKWLSVFRINSRLYQLYLILCSAFGFVGVNLKIACMRVKTFIPLILLFLAACTKEAADKPNLQQNSLEGEWKLVSVKDKSTGSIAFKPSGYAGDIIIKFKGNSFSGHTLINAFSDGSFTLNSNELMIGVFSMTKVMEEEWGSSFVTVLHACGLQSIYPCRPSKISFEGNKLHIESPLRYDLTLERN